MVNPQKEVYFIEYCSSCKYYDLDENDLPCNECLNDTVNNYSHKPTHYEEDD